MVRTYKYRLYPNKTQNRLLYSLLDEARWVWNEALQQRRMEYHETRKTLSKIDQGPWFREVRNVDPERLGKLNASCMIEVLHRLDKAFAAFFRRLKEGEKPGFPRFKNRNRFRSLEFKPEGGGCKLQFTPKPKLYMQNVGLVRLKLHRPLPEEAILKHTVVKVTPTGKWFVTFMCDVSEVEETRSAGTAGKGAIGLDVGLKSLIALSDDRVLPAPQYLRHGLSKLRVAQRKLSRRKKGSNRRRKAKLLVAKHHEKVANQRRDLWHQVTSYLVDTYKVIVLEDLPLSFMTQNHHLALSAHDAGLGLFKELLLYKAEEAGTVVLFVDPRNTSQKCSGCGKKVKKGLGVRVHRCPHCGLVLDRDVNAARVVLAFALKPKKLRARFGPSELNVDRLVKRALRSYT